MLVARLVQPLLRFRRAWRRRSTRRRLAHCSSARGAPKHFHQVSPPRRVNARKRATTSTRGFSRLCRRGRSVPGRGVHDDCRNIFRRVLSPRPPSPVADVPANDAPPRRRVSKSRASSRLVESPHQQPSRDSPSRRASADAETRAATLPVRTASSVPRQPAGRLWISSPPSRYPSRCRTSAELRDEK